MTVLMLLGPRLHEFLGRRRFLALYFAASVGGTLATQACHLDPTWEAHAVARSHTRYENILLGVDPGEAVGLGASDAMSGLFACFYGGAHTKAALPRLGTGTPWRGGPLACRASLRLTFPRQPVPFLWMKLNAFWAMLPRRMQQSQVTNALRRTRAADRLRVHKRR
eukprot:gene9099-3960_t